MLNSNQKNQPNAHEALNHAYSVLSDDSARADYLLQLAERPLDPDTPIDEPSFLMDMMDYRIRLDENGDVAGVLADLKPMAAQMGQKFWATYQAHDYQSAMIWAQKLRFINKVIKDARAKPAPAGDDDFYV